MNTQLINSLTQIILSLSEEERNLLTEKIKLRQQQNKEIDSQILALKNQLRTYESRYQMSSNEFYQKFRAGELGDDIDFFEWSVFYEMWLAAQKEVKLLQN